MAGAGHAGVRGSNQVRQALARSRYRYGSGLMAVLGINEEQRQELVKSIMAAPEITKAQRQELFTSSDSWQAILALVSKR
jgi:hypothetical protein